MRNKLKMIFVMRIPWAESKVFGLTTKVEKNLYSGKAIYSLRPKAVLQLRKAVFSVPAKSLNAH